MEIGLDPYAAWSPLDVEIPQYFTFKPINKAAIISLGWRLNLLHKRGNDIQVECLNSIVVVAKLRAPGMLLRFKVTSGGMV